MRIRRPDRGKEASIGIHRHLNRIDQLREHLLACKQVHLHPLSNLHFADRFFAPEVLVFSIGQGTWNIRFDRQFGWKVIVFDIDHFAFGNGPNTLIAVGGFYVEDLHFAHHDICVGLAKPS